MQPFEFQDPLGNNTSVDRFLVYYVFSAKNDQNDVDIRTNERIISQLMGG